MLTGNVLHQVELRVAPPGCYWHVFPYKYEPRASNLNSMARLAWRDGEHGMFYTGGTPAAALWETVLRYAAINQDVVSTSHQHLQGMALAQLTLRDPVPALDLRPPFRRGLVEAGSSLDLFWDQVLKEPDHEKTHSVTNVVMQQLRSAGYPDGAALIWYSRQAGSETATLFFEPPMQSPWWDVEEIHFLDTTAGQNVIAGALGEQGLVWRGAALGDEFEPPVWVD